MRILQWLLALGLLSHSLQATAAEAPPLPQDIFIKTPTQSFNSRYYYALHQGRIWIKPNRQVTGKDTPWQLMGCEGLPCKPDDPEFVVPEAIVEISADADELTSIDNKGYFYVRTSKGPGWFSKDEWVMKHGFPKDKMQLSKSFAQKRAMSMGRRHYDVMWHEDMDNNVHHYGTMGTSSIYLLDPNGYEIWYTDNGLPADFSNQLCGPERGAFVAENLQASAGTLFVINRAGEMYTHMNDFDLNGGTSMFISYTYTPQPFRPEDKGTDYNTHLTPWRIPTSEWVKQPPLPLSKKARGSTQISILQNGHGNAARELRVAGRNAEGKHGYWSKGIMDKQWQFVEAPLQISPEQWTEPDRPALRVPLQDLKYQGRGLTNDPEYPVYMELLNFNLHCSPATLRIWYKQQPYDLTLHSIDAWINVQRQDPGRDGTPQLMLGTLEVPQALQQKIEQEGLEPLPEPYGSLHLKTFQLQLAATTEHVYLFRKKEGILARLHRSSPIPGSLKTFDYKTKMPLATFTAAMFRDSHENFLRLYEPELLIWDLESLTPADLPALEKLIKRNRARLQDYIDGLELIRQAEQLAWWQAFGSAMLRNFYYTIAAPFWVPNASAVCRTAPELLWSYYSMDNYLNESAKSWYSQMISMISSRLERYAERKLELEKALKTAQQQAAQAP